MEKREHCGLPMKSGLVLVEGVTSGIPDFPNQSDDRGQTMSPSGQSKLTKCLKCQVCGLSIIPANQKESKRNDY